MMGIIDTSSLVSYARYYHPFDMNGNLAKAIQSLFERGEIIVIDKVLAEARLVGRGVALQGLPFIATQRSRIVNTSAVLPNTLFFNELETNYCNQSVRRNKGLNDAEFANQKTAYLTGAAADAKLLLYAISKKSVNPVVVTEETVNENDGKLFKKIPSICLLAGINCCTLPEFFKSHCGFNLSDLLR